MPDQYSRDYDVDKVKGIDSDPRFKAAAREGILTQIAYFIIVIGGITIAYMMAPEDSQDVSYVFGMFPTWFMAGVAVYLAGAIFLLTYFMRAKTFSFSSRMDDDETSEVKEDSKND